MNKEYYKIVEFSLTKYLIRGLLFLWIIFASVRFNINPTFFGITIIAALIFILTISEMSIEANKNFIEITHKKWLSLLNRKEIIEYDEIVDIVYIRPQISAISIILNLIMYAPGTLEKGPRLSITLKEDRWAEIRTFGSEQMNKELIQFVKLNLKQK